ncbi:beta-lactamase/transpeptidase-like protein [Clohesyomyces aquaticus]|uniref:Beta-lactamase/transpeptidase-like protein n=1 Tax=Clohesyomyces aquaticus TaxID=1231657 RepID=A0A1Y1YBF3_9PLEO|nr:beta-lactamase/transpeptidase-like protein [Clohesyomyces aquaticus]
MSRSISLAALLSLLMAVPSAATSCPIYGPVFPTPTKLTESIVAKSALQNLSESISASFEHGKSAYGPVDSTAAYAIQIFSLDTEDPLLEYYHDGTTLSNATGVRKIDGDSIFRIGSISKLLTIYLFLAKLGDSLWNDPVTKHIPELRNRDRSQENPVEYVNWDGITLGALAGHVAGLPRDLIDLLGLYANTDETFGLPPLSPADYPSCVLTATNYTCDRNKFFESINERQPTFLPNTKPAYSNTAFMLLGYALETITGQPYKEILKDSLIDPLGLTGTSYSKPEDDEGVVPINASVSDWARDFGDAAPIGGLYASTNDLARIGRSILNSTLLDKNITRAWLQPTSFTSSLFGVVGRPWEIFRAADIGPSKRLVDIYTKGGDIGMYHTNLAVIPDYNIGFVTAVAGQGSHVFLDNLIVDVLFPVVEEAAREQADARYAGTYKARNGLNSSLAISTDPQLPGLGVSSWISNGTDFLSAFSSLFAGTPITLSNLRIYPTNLRRQAGNGTEEAWRMGLDFGSDSEVVGPFSACGSWFSVDLLAVGKRAVDEFLFTLGGDEDETTVSPSGFDIILYKE